MYSGTIEFMNSSDFYYFDLWLDIESVEEHVFTDLFAPSKLQSLPCEFYFLPHIEQNNTDARQSKPAKRPSNL